jgi:5-methylcytosine-specific restriction endonuclease McrA
MASKNSEFNERESVAPPLEPLRDEYECSTIIGRSVHSLRRDRLIGVGVPYIKCGSLVKYDPRDIRAYIERNRRGGKEAK